VSDIASGSPRRRVKAAQSRIRLIGPRLEAYLERPALREGQLHHALKELGEASEFLSKTLAELEYRRRVRRK
jgi:hypothetical protein